MSKEVSNRAWDGRGFESARRNASTATSFSAELTSDFITARIQLYSETNVAMRPMVTKTYMWTAVKEHDGNK